MNSIERTQYQASLATSGTWTGTNTSKLYDELDWESLSDEGDFIDWTPSYLRHLIPPPRTMLCGHRNENVILDIPSNTTRDRNSFFPNCTKAWNNTVIEFRRTESLKHFKKSLTCLIRPKGQSLFGVHEPLGVKYIFRLRVKLGHLKHHKFSGVWSAPPDMRYIPKYYNVLSYRQGIIHNGSVTVNKDIL